MLNISWAHGHLPTARNRAFPPRPHASSGVFAQGTLAAVSGTNEGFPTSILTKDTTRPAVAHPSSGSFPRSHTIGSKLVSADYKSPSTHIREFPQPAGHVDLNSITLLARRQSMRPQTGGLNGPRVNGSFAHVISSVSHHRGRVGRQKGQVEQYSFESVDDFPPLPAVKNNPKSDVSFSEAHQEDISEAIPVVRKHSVTRSVLPASFIIKRLRYLLITCYC